MSDRVFYEHLGSRKLHAVADYLGCVLEEGAPDIAFDDIRGLSDATEKDISFLSNKKYIPLFKQSKAGACIVPADFTENSESGTILLKAKNPYYSYARLVDLFYRPAKKYPAKIMPSAYVSDSARIGENCYIGHNVVIEDEAEIGDNSVIESGSVIDYRVKIGKRAMIYSGASISHAEIGDDAVILPGARIGQDGFGFATDQGIHKKIYHTGKVIIGNNVEVGANSTIDRGSMGNTVIEDLCRIDNLVQIAHNVHVKKGTILVAQVGIAGSSKIGSYCALGGQVGISGHVTIADHVQVAGQGGVMQDILEAGIMGGSPAVPIRDWHRQTIILKKLINEKRK